MAFFSLVITLFLMQTAWADRAVVDSFSGKPTGLYIENKEVVQIRKNQQFEKGFVLKTSATDLVKLKMGQEFYITIFPDSEMKVLGFELENNGYDIHEVIFVRGQFLVKNDSKLDQELQIKYTSDFFNWVSTEKSIIKNFYVDLNLQTGKAAFCAGEVEMKIQLFNHEIQHILKPYEGIHFYGVSENGSLVFDHLLEGRKSPQGKWQEKYKCDFSQILKKAQTLEKKQQVLVQKIIQTKKKFLKKQKEEYDKSLCHRPNGQLNQCLWKTEKSDCVRYRCNGEGQWAERFALPTSQKKTCIERASLKTTVANCDY